MPLLLAIALVIALLSCFVEGQTSDADDGSSGDLVSLDCMIAEDIYESCLDAEREDCERFLPAVEFLCGD